MADSDIFPPIGSICTFTCERGSLELGVPTPYAPGSPKDRRTTACGTVVEVKPMEPYGPGKIPTAAVTVEGRTKKRVTIDGAGCDLKVWASWSEALAEVKRLNGTTATASPAGRKPTA